MKEVRIDLSELAQLGAPKWSAAEILRRLLASWGARHRIIELKVPPGPFPTTVYPIRKEVDEEMEKEAVAKVVLFDGHQTATALVFDVFDKSECSPVAKIEAKPGYEVVRVTGKLSILKELERRGVNPAVSNDILNAWLDRLRGEATAPQLELLLQHREVLDFLQSITEEAKQRQT